MNAMTKAEIIYTRLKKQIMTGELPEGKHIVIDLVAKELDSSPIPVREALKRLQAEGLVDHIPHKGARVVQFNVESVMEVIAVRTVLECYATRLAANNMTSGCLKELRTINKKLHKIAEAGDYRAYIKYNRKFHSVIYNQSGNSLLQRTIDDLWTGGNWSGKIFTMFPERMKASNEAHEEIIRCLAAGDGEGASGFIEAAKRNNLELYKMVAQETVTVSDESEIV